MPTFADKPEAAGAAGPSAASPAPSPAGGVQLKKSLAGKPYGTQAAMVSPRGRPDPKAQAAREVQTTADAGAQGPGQPLPHLDRIQGAFGHHDISGVRAHVGGKAGEAGEQLGAEAYATGGDLAFRAQPDVRTAAHEAAHAVQQERGVDLPGGVGESGDAFEQHADAVADKVAAGESAQELLDAKAPAPTQPGKRAAGKGAATQRKVQFLHGDVDNARIHPDLKGSAPGAATVAQAVDQKFGGAARDENYNNKLKVDFECKLAALLLGNEGWVSGPVRAVSQRILSYLSQKAESNRSDLNADLLKLARNLGGTPDKPNEVFFGRLADKIPAEQLVADGSVRKLLEGQGTLPQQLFAQHQFMDMIWHDDGKGDYWQNRKGNLVGIAEMVAPKQLRRGANSEVTDPATGTKSVARDVFGEKWVDDAASPGQIGAGGAFADQADYQKKAGMTGAYEGHSGRHARARFDAKTDKEAARTGDAPRSRAGQVFGNPHGTTTEAASGIYARHGEGGAVTDTLGTSFKPDGAGETQHHSRGVDRLTMDEEGLFIQQARVVLDMPLAGGVSGTTTDLLECAKIFGLSPDETWLYAVAVLGHLEGAGGHSFHEIATAAKTAGIPYVPGDYRSFLPPTVVDQGPVQALFHDPAFKDVPGIGAPLGTLTPRTPAAAPAAAPAAPRAPATPPRP